MDKKKESVISAFWLLIGLFALINCAMKKSPIEFVFIGAAVEFVKIISDFKNEKTKKNLFYVILMAIMLIALGVLLVDYYMHK